MKVFLYYPEFPLASQWQAEFRNQFPHGQLTIASQIKNSQGHHLVRDFDILIVRYTNPSNRQLFFQYKEIFQQRMIFLLGDDPAFQQDMIAWRHPFFLSQNDPNLLRNLLTQIKILFFNTQQLENPSSAKNYLERQLNETQKDLRNIHWELIDTVEYFYSLVFASLGISLIAANGDGNVILCNPGAESLLSFSEKEIHGQNIIDLFETPLEGFQTFEMIKKSLEHSNKYRLEAILKGKTGRKFFCELVVTQQKYTYNAERLYSFFIKDITQRKHLESVARKTAEELRRKKNEMEKELLTASKLQRHLIPQDLPSVTGIQIYADYMPSTFLGGDYYDVFELPNDKVGFFMADVAGHGASASLIVSAVKALVSAYAQYFSTPQDIASLINQEMVKLLPNEAYLSLFYGILDTTNWQFTYVRAGHPFPLLLRSNGDIEKLDALGALVGIDENIMFQENTVKLEPGDRIFLFTDGILEVRVNTPSYEHYQEYGYQHLESIIKTLPLDINPIAVIFQDLQRKSMRTKFEDDLAMIVIEIDRLEKTSHFEIHSSFNEMASVLNDFEMQLRAQRYPEKAIMDLSTIMYEALANAIEHGNENIFHKKVFVDYTVAPTYSIIVVEDEGPGFNWKDRMNANLPSDGSSRGRGVLFMLGLGQEVSFNDKGNKITIHYALDSQ